MSQSSPSDKLTDALIKLIWAGSGSYALYSLYTDDLPKAAISGIVSAGAALMTSFGQGLMGQLTSSMKNRGKQVGLTLDTAIDENLQHFLARATNAKEAYLLCQALDCRDYKPEGMGPRDRTFIPMLHSVFVPLELDAGAIAPGFQKSQLRPLATTGEPPELYIWDLLRYTQREPTYRQLAIVAWGGFGKTTLLKHLAYIFGSQQHQNYDVPFWVPILLPLRAYRQQFASNPPPDLPELVMQHHVKSLAELDKRLNNLPDSWARDLLTEGKALIMLDGFDEIPEAERQTLARWIHRQMRRFGKSVFILASRPKAYQESFTEPLRTKIWVRPFNPKQQERFVNQWYASQERLARGGLDSPEVEREVKRNAQNLLSQIQNPQRPELAALAKNPLLLNLLATYHRSNPGVELPRQRAELYQDIVTLQLRKRPEARDIELPLSPTDRQKVLQYVALEMMQRNLRLMPEAAFTELIAAALQHQRQALSAETFLEQIIDVSELIVRQGLEGCEFAHLSFQEFLAAAQIKDLSQESLLYPHLQDADTGTGEDDRAWWRQTILLYAAQIANPTKLIEEALEQSAAHLAYACYKELEGTYEQLLSSLKLRIQIARYAELEKLLKAQQWEDADLETYRLMITTIDKEGGQGFTRQDIEKFPCEELMFIDRLWTRYSNGKFGFSIQNKIWHACNSPESIGEEWNRFCLKVGWKDSKTTRYLEQKELQASLYHSPKGEFPWLLMTSGWWIITWDGSSFGDGRWTLLERVAACMP